MLQDIVGELWIVVAFIIIAVGKAVLDKFKNDKYNKYKSDRRHHCPDHTELMKTTGGMKIDLTEVKTDVKWIKGEIQNGRRYGH